MLGMAEGGRSPVHDLVDDLRALATCVASPRPVVTASPDPDDNVLLAIAGAGLADLLVTGDKRDHLSLQTHGAVQIVTARAALERIG
jgi:predicted nucleic acid-binding protein